MENPVKILIVDDESMAREVLRRFLEKTEYEIEEADNGELAIALVKRFSPDVVLMDIMMPRIQGDEVLSIIRDWKPETRIIVVTGLADQEVHRDCIRKGAHAVLEKPVDHKLLKAKILEALGRT